MNDQHHCGQVGIDQVNELPETVFDMATRVMETHVPRLIAERGCDCLQCQVEVRMAIASGLFQAGTNQFGLALGCTMETNELPHEAACAAAGRHANQLMQVIAEFCTTQLGEWNMVKLPSTNDDSTYDDWKPLEVEENDAWGWTIDTIEPDFYFPESDDDEIQD